MMSCLQRLCQTVVVWSILFAGAVVSEETAGVRVHKRSDDMTPLQTVVDGHSNQLSAILARLTALEKRMNTAELNVAFHAHHTADPFSVASHGTIVYDTVTTNIGQAYDSKSGFFTAPHSGTYTFFMTCMAKAGTTEEPSILVEGSVVAACHSNMLTGPVSELGSTFTTVHLHQGDRVWVRLLETAEDVRGYFWNTFAGFLLRADVQG